MRRLLVVTAVRAETRAVLAAIRDPRRERGAIVPRWDARTAEREMIVLEGGIGGVAAERAVELARVDCDLVLSVGFAGALVAGLVPGDVVLPRRVVWDDDAGARRTYEVPAALHGAAMSAMPPNLRVTDTGTLFSSPVIVTTPAAKAEAARRYGATAVEMEAHALAALAVRRHIPLLAVRTILDGAEISLEALPPNLSTSWSARAGLIVAPAAWPLVLALRRHVITASRMLTAVLAALFVAPLQVD